MKLSLLEDGVLDYKGPRVTLATPDGLPIAAMGTGVKSAPSKIRKSRFKAHIKDCPLCSKNQFCEIGEKLAEHPLD